MEAHSLPFLLLQTLSHKYIVVIMMMLMMVKKKRVRHHHVHLTIIHIYSTYAQTVWGWDGHGTRHVDCRLQSIFIFKKC